MIDIVFENDEYICEYNNIIFCWDEEPEEIVEDEMKKIAEAYHSSIERIATFILEEIKDIYEVASVEEVIQKIGVPRIDLDMEQVTYCEQSFDDIHIFSFEFADNFERLMYFAIDG